jgi:hypothetical protein
MKSRRTLLKMLMALVAGAPLAPRIAAAATAPAAAAAGRNGFFIVNGWVLTRADLEALNIDAL